MRRYGSRLKPGLHISHKDVSTDFEHVFKCPRNGLVFISL